MKHFNSSILVVTLFMLFSCVNHEVKEKLDGELGETELEKPEFEKPLPDQKQSHGYGGWYCPDNLVVFPAVDIEVWDKVPVIGGRMPTQEETWNGESLIFIDSNLYPKAKPLDVITPQLARYHSESSGNDELIIVIQAVNVANDSVVGFRYLNGGNGSSRMNEVKFLTQQDVDALPRFRFVDKTVELNATSDDVFKVLTNSNYASRLADGFSEFGIYESQWKRNLKVTVNNSEGELLREGVATAVWPNAYVQIDYNIDGENYVEKIFMTMKDEGRKTELHIVVGPFQEEFEGENASWERWVDMVKVLSEQSKWIGVN